MGTCSNEAKLTALDAIHEQPVLFDVALSTVFTNEDEMVPCILQPEESSKGYLKNWARLIQKIYEVDPLTCPKCHGPMRVISFIEDQDVIKKILKHLGLWEVKPRPPPKATGPPKPVEHHIDYPISQIPVSDKWLYVDPEYPETFPS